MPVENNKKAQEYAAQFFRLSREQEKTDDSAMLAEMYRLNELYKTANGGGDLFEVTGRKP
jgi:hypothetical protein